MSWNLNCQYACLSLKNVSNKEELDRLLREFAQMIGDQILEEPNETAWGILFEDDLPESIEEVKRLILPRLLNQIKELSFGDGCASVVVSTDIDSDTCESEFNKELTKFLFSKSGTTHFLLRSASFDESGGYSHQWIGYFKGREIILEHTDQFFERIFQAVPGELAAAI